MSTSILKMSLSNSDCGVPQIISATTDGAALHTFPLNATDTDEVWLYATNLTATAATINITIYNLATTVSHYVIYNYSIAAGSGLTVLLPGSLAVKGDGSTGRYLRAFSNTANAIAIHGFINRITQT